MRFRTLRESNDISIRFVTERKTPGEILVSCNGNLLGSVVKDVDGFYYFWPEHSTSGAWSQELLRALACFLEDLNRPWQKVISRDLSPWRQWVRSFLGIK